MIAISLMLTLIGATDVGHWPSIDDTLRWEGDRYDTLGPTGRRLFTEKMQDGLGFHGRYSYIHAGEIRDPITLSIETGHPPATTELVNQVWYPSHLERRWKIGALTVTERKFITEDDVMVDVVDVANDTGAAYYATMGSEFAKDRIRLGSTYRKIDLRGVANADPRPDHDLFAAESGFRKWIEGEDHARQQGSTGEDRKPGASGGRVLGMEFGGKASHWAEYEFECPDVDELHVYFRIARGSEGWAEWQAFLDGEDLGRFGTYPTGGWGERDEQFLWSRVKGGSVKAGRHVLRIESREDGANINFDGLLLSDGPWPTPPSRLGEETLAWLEREQVVYQPGETRRGAIPFDLIDPKTNGGKGIIVLPGGTRDRQGRTYPSSVTISTTIPLGADRLHVLGHCGGFVPPQDRDAALQYVIHCNRGEPVVHEVGAEWFQPWTHGLQTYSIPLPRDREVTRIEIIDTGTPAAPVVAAMTLEFDAPGGAKDRLYKEGEFHGVSAVGLGAGQYILHGARFPLSFGRYGLGGKEDLTFVIAFAFGDDAEDANRRVETWLATPDPLAIHKEAYQRWFENNCPTFDCDDPYITKLWAYRWFVARHCLSEANAGRLKHPCFFEGMHGGWYPTQIGYSSPHIIDETRWLRNSIYAFGQGRNHAENANANGVFESVRTNWIGGWYTNWIPMSMWGAYLVHPDKDYLRGVVDAMAADIRGNFKQFDKDGDKLCTPPSHWPTGMEWQPAFFYFNEYDNTKPEAPLERGDLVGYQYGNARAVADAYRVLGENATAAEFDELADDIRAACLAKMWNEKDHWFYAIRETDDEPALCKEIVGFYPFFTLLPPTTGAYAAALEYLPDDKHFWNPYPLTTVDKECPAYTPHHIQWPGPGGTTTGCMWNGPTWPHANSIIANVLANVLRDYHTAAITPDIFWRFLLRFTHLHFVGDELGKPMIQEYYDGESGTGWGCYDYFHSTYNDLIIRHVVGVTPSAGDELRIDPIVGTLKHFRLDRLRYHGKDIGVTWNGDGHYPDAPKGFSVTVGGVLAGSRDGLGPLTVKLQ